MAEHWYTQMALDELRTRVARLEGIAQARREVIDQLIEKVKELEKRNGG